MFNCSGHHTILIPPSEVEANPALWLTAVSQYKVRDTFCSYGELYAVNSCPNLSIHLLDIEQGSTAVSHYKVKNLILMVDSYPIIGHKRMHIRLFSIT
jgi:hypothetical protein